MQPPELQSRWQLEPTFAVDRMAKSAPGTFPYRRFPPSDKAKAIQQIAMPAITLAWPIHAPFKTSFSAEEHSHRTGFEFHHGNG